MQPSLTLLRDGLLVGRHTVISFNRTLRIPEDGKHYDLPAGFGHLPILRIEDVANRVPEKWRQEGGLIIPLYQREALFLEFCGVKWRPTIAKVAVGQISAITGKPHDLDLKSGRQDYVVVPVQRWLDGINAGNGIVRQFVAMPLGQGYTVEAQITDEETHGGFQLAAFEPKEGRFSEPRSAWHGSKGGVLCAKREDTSTDIEMGIAAGGSIRQQIFEDVYGVETWDGETCVALNLHIVNSAMYEEITGRPAPATPISEKTYRTKGLPWFRHFDENRRIVSAPKAFSKILSIQQINNARGAALRSDVSFEYFPVDVVKTLTLSERINELRSSAFASYSESRYFECLTQSQMCGELIESHSSELRSGNQAKSFEQVASESFCLASECASRLKQFALAEVLASWSLRLAFSEEALSWRMHARMHSGKVEEGRKDCYELLRINPSHKIFQETDTPLPLHENGLGMKFTPIPGTSVFFSIWDTRVRDFRAYADATEYRQQGGIIVSYGATWGLDANASWENPKFAQTDCHPVVGVSWQDAKAFCKWLTDNDRDDGWIGKDQEYRLPTDAEWSIAVGLPQESGNTPAEKAAKAGEFYPWGAKWPPPKEAGNYDPSLVVDSHDYTSPVWKFPANRFGLYDMSGNVWQWCEDWYYEDKQDRVMRGGSWDVVNPEFLLSSARCGGDPDLRSSVIGFRCVLAFVY